MTIPIMENYRKGKNAEEELDPKKIPFPNLPENFTWMQVRGGTKIRNVLSYALEHFAESGYLVWTGFGPSVGKTVTCANIMKSKCGSKLHQLTKLSYRTVEEYWDPIRPELDQLVVKRMLPMIHILLTKEAHEPSELGYQPPNYKVSYRSAEHSNRRNHNKNYIGQKQRSSKTDGQKNAQNTKQISKDIGGPSKI